MSWRFYTVNAVVLEEFGWLEREPLSGGVSHCQRCGTRLDLAAVFGVDRLLLGEEGRLRVLYCTAQYGVV